MLLLKKFTWNPGLLQQHCGQVAHTNEDVESVFSSALVFMGLLDFIINPEIDSGC